MRYKSFKLNYPKFSRVCEFVLYNYDNNTNNIYLHKVLDDLEKSSNREVTHRVSLIHKIQE